MNDLFNFICSPHYARQFALLNSSSQFQGEMQNLSNLWNIARVMKSRILCTRAEPKKYLPSLYQMRKMWIEIRNQICYVENALCQENFFPRTSPNLLVDDFNNFAFFNLQGDSGGINVKTSILLSFFKAFLILGPLMNEKTGRWYLIGIVSAGYSCASKGQPGIYHRVSVSTACVATATLNFTSDRWPTQ